MSEDLDSTTGAPAVTRGSVIAAILAVAGLMLILTVGGVVFVGRFSPLLNDDREHPSDEALETTFREHEADFEKLIEMSNVDATVIRIAPDFTWLEDSTRWPRLESELGFSGERWNEYRELFRRLRLTKGLARYPDGQTVELIASTQGLLTGGSGKGYVYSSKELKPLHNSLNDLGPTGRHIYKRLKAPNWYLFYYSH